MAIYTRTGDDGFTLDPDGQRIGKDDVRIEAGGTVDELNAHIGLCVSAADETAQAQVRDALAPVRKELFTVGALVASAGSGHPGTIDETAVGRMERQIDDVSRRLGQLKHFIIPGGCELACRLHVARTVCRRAECALVAAGRTTECPTVVLRYVNRLSDLLFALARLANKDAGISDP